MANDFFTRNLDYDLRLFWLELDEETGDNTDSFLDFYLYDPLLVPCDSAEDVVKTGVRNQ
jgi:hypothetical protein